MKSPGRSRTPRRAHRRRQVAITNVNTNASRSSFTTDAGVYAFPSLPPGTYNVRVEKTGFKTATSNQVEVQVQQTARLDFELPSARSPNRSR